MKKTFKRDVKIDFKSQRKICKQMITDNIKETSMYENKSSKEMSKVTSMFESKIQTRS